MSTVTPTKAQRRIAAVDLLGAAWQYRHVLFATSKLELRQKYAGSVLGSAWIVLYPLMFLSIYVFLYLVIFKMRFSGFSQLNYVIYVFSGLIPYLMFMEGMGRASVIIRENLHLLRNVILPAELVVVRLVLVAMLAQLVSFGVLLVMISIDGELTWRLVFLPLVMIFAALFILGFALLIAGLGAIFSDVFQIVNLLLIFCLFVSPIAFKEAMVPPDLRLVVNLNPISYLLEGFRWSLLASYEAHPVRLAIFPLMSLAIFSCGAAFFKRVKGLMVDHV